MSEIRLVESDPKELLPMRAVRSISGTFIDTDGVVAECTAIEDTGGFAAPFGHLIFEGKRWVIMSKTIPPTLDHH
jgi:hypothetical protein